MLTKFLQAVPVQVFESEESFLQTTGAGMQAQISQRLRGLQESMGKADAVDKELQKNKRREKLAALKAKRREANAAKEAGGGMALLGSPSDEEDASEGDGMDSADESVSGPGSGSDSEAELEPISTKRRKPSHAESASKKRRHDEVAKGL